MLLDNIITFRKTQGQRLKEIQDVLNCPTDALNCPTARVPASDVADEWSYRLELLLEPAGWQAIWKISRQICEDLQINFPKLVFVNVNGVDFKEHSAYVSVVSVQDDISIPENHEVPLIQLYPTRKQINNVLNIDSTADCLDQLRFFYNHLWYPWDLDEDDNEGDWASCHLEMRLQLFYDIQQGAVSPHMASKIDKLVQNARSIYSRILELEDCLKKEAGKEEQSSDNEGITYELMQLHIRLEPVKSELSLLENPNMRMLAEKQLKEEESHKASSDVVVVWQGANMDAFSKFISEVKSVIDPSACVRVAPCLEAGVEMAISRNTFVLDPRSHNISCTGSLKEGGKIIGITMGENRSIISRNKSGSVLLDVTTNVLTIQNVILQAKNVESAVLVYGMAALHLLNCCIVGDGTASNGAGLVVLPGGGLRVEKCEFSGLRVGILLHRGASAMIKDCKIMKCSTGVEAGEKLNLSLENTGISDCKEGILIGIDNGDNISGGRILLEGLKGICGSDLYMTRNKTDVKLWKNEEILEASDPSSILNMSRNSTEL